MNPTCHKFVHFILTSAPQHDKAKLQAEAARLFKLTKDRSVWHNKYFAVRLCYSKNKSTSFSNTVLSLSMLEKYDDRAVFVVLVRREESNLILLANSTFIKKLSHSSQALSTKNIRGSFNGSDIIKVYDNIDNTPENFDLLFNLHKAMEWDDNLERIVEMTSQITPTGRKFCPSPAQTQNIYASVSRANRFAISADYLLLLQDLNERCARFRNEIIIASQIENTNIRGRIIESLITADESTGEEIARALASAGASLPEYATRNDLGDYVRSFADAVTFTDIKTKVVYVQSNPKAFNIDKFLETMAQEKSVFLFFFIGPGQDYGIKTLLCSVYHSELIDNTILQYHWAGRSSRGVAQYNGAIIDKMLAAPKFSNTISGLKSKEFLQNLLAR